MARISEREVRGIINHFKNLPDPRSHINRRHLLVDVLVICVLAVIAGADGPVSIGQWAKINAGWLKRHLKLPYGIPAHDTIGRVLEALSPRAFQQCFQAWLASLCDAHGEDSGRPQLAVDGKTLRRSHDRKRELGPLHLVSVWATQQGVSLGQLATEEKSNEITAIPELLKQVEVAGTIVTIDAAGCQKNIAAQIVEAGGDYVLGLKGNQEKLHEAVQDLVDDHLEDDFARQQVVRHEEHDRRHGRKEHRTYYQFDAPQDLPGRDAWRGLRTIGVVIRQYKARGQEHCEVRYFISSLRRGAKTFARAVRGHWGIENTLHWSLDMTFREDESRVRARRVADNLAWLRRIALTLLKQHPGKQSIVMKRRMAGWSRAFLIEVLVGTAS